MDHTSRHHPPTGFSLILDRTCTIVGWLVPSSILSRICSSPGSSSIPGYIIDLRAMRFKKLEGARTSRGISPGTGGSTGIFEAGWKIIAFGTLESTTMHPPTFL